jgi:tellurite resistance protein
MVLAQLRLLPAYLRLKFMPSFWAFTFAWAAVVFGAMLWLHAGQPAGWKAYTYIMLAAITLFISAIAGRTVTALTRGQFIPNAPAAATISDPSPLALAPDTRTAPG